VIERTDLRGDWSAAACLNHYLDGGPWTGKYCLDSAIAAIAHPTVQPAPACFVLDKGAVAHALHPAAHNNVANDIAAHTNSPASPTRAPVQCEADQRSTERT